ncbi:protein FAR1-RELATED SEQUENCE 5-like [Amborella trichopoda]|uniref:protein FAR1-RELATED SEQUENCE 5-like n=1 Tax=Amborella trichopoda TaxID=13333 RepID=UPI0009BEB433|nr:protein FAR1-RELATED SEQUENCE 5-like [Amborella trichopoda]|eukprot:XP_020525866.1 protein FAR1-RELATED SEQUENCE 5-like [Amborella trichopoda]
MDIDKDQSHALTNDVVSYSEMNSWAITPIVGEDAYTVENMVEASHYVKDDARMIENPMVKIVIESEENLKFEPFEGMEFESQESAKEFYNEYARRVGFSMHASSLYYMHDEIANARRFVCSKQGF